MLQVKISEFKSKLSSYLARVRAGQSVLVLDRHTPVARLIPVEAHRALVVSEAMETAAIIRRRGKRVKLRKPVNLTAILRQDRDQR